MAGPALQALNGEQVIYAPPDGEGETITCTSFVEDVDIDRVSPDADTTQSRAEMVVAVDEIETPVRLATVIRNEETWVVEAVERLADGSHRLELLISEVQSKGAQSRRVRR